MLLVSLAILCQAQVAPKPPKTAYDAKRNVTVFSTGDVRTGGYSGMSAEFEFPGQTVSLPSTVSMGFGALRLTNGQSEEHDRELLRWQDLKSVTLTYSGKIQEFPASPEFKVSRNKTVELLFGRALEESVSIKLTPDQFKAMVASDDIKIQLGKDVQELKGKSLNPLRKLADCLPNQ